MTADAEFLRFFAAVCGGLMVLTAALAARDMTVLGKVLIIGPAALAFTVIAGVLELGLIFAVGATVVVGLTAHAAQQAMRDGRR